MSEQARHTPGPWRPDFDDEMGVMRLRSYRDSQACIIAIIRNNELDDKLSGERYCMVEQARANARLIAAAPELLALARSLTDWLYAIRKKDEALVIESAPDGVSLCHAISVLTKAGGAL